MIEPYTAVGLVPTFWGIRRREDIRQNLEHIEALTTAAFWLANLDTPVRLIAVPEGGLQGFNDEILDLDPAEFTRTCAIDIPGPETDRLGKLARAWNVFIMAQAKARHEDWPDRFFNVGFVIDPDGNVILKHGRRHGDRPARRDDGHGGQLSGERAGAGAERRRGRLPRVAAGAVHPERLLRDLQPGARAREHMYVIAPNISSYYLFPDSKTAIDAGGGQSMIVDHRGAITGKQLFSNGSTCVTGVVNVEALRHHRLNAQVSNWAKDIRAELAQIIYEQPIYPKNLYADAVPGRHADYKRDVLDRQVRLMQERGIWRKPAGL
jgi:predicted amidohydrolase